MPKRPYEERKGLLDERVIEFLLKANKQGYNIPRHYGNCVKDGLNGLQHYILLERYLPERYHKQLFTRESLEPVIDAILHHDESLSEDELDARRLRIAIMLARRGLNAYISHVQKQNTTSYLAIHEVMKGPLAILRAADAELQSLEKNQK
ncbi:MAG: hypothetical protein NWE83_06565 [Candidatus Bathyarchaeota archaeon]|nr:hypothetical protein [Candidatus Bathyarchaeota archaeon]